MAIANKVFFVNVRVLLGASWRDDDCYMGPVCTRQHSHGMPTAGSVCASPPPTEYGPGSKSLAEENSPHEIPEVIYKFEARVVHVVTCKLSGQVMRHSR